jgi:hypothetical protein
MVPRNSLIEFPLVHREYGEVFLEQWPRNSLIEQSVPEITILYFLILLFWGNGRVTGI